MSENFTKAICLSNGKGSLRWVVNMTEYTDWRSKGFKTINENAIDTLQKLLKKPLFKSDEKATRKLQEKIELMRDCVKEDLWEVV
jgi:trimethylamine:corrinoid methyltransferase-like protein